MQAPWITTQTNAAATNGTAPDAISESTARAPICAMKTYTSAKAQASGAREAACGGERQADAHRRDQQDLVGALREHRRQFGNQAGDESGGIGYAQAEGEQVQNVVNLERPLVLSGACTSTTCRRSLARVKRLNQGAKFLTSNSNGIQMM